MFLRPYRLWVSREVNPALEEPGAVMMRPTNFTNSDKFLNQA